MGLRLKRKAGEVSIDENSKIKLKTAPGQVVELGDRNALAYVSDEYAEEGSFQPVAVDLNLDPDAGTSEAGETAFLAPVMGNLLGDTLTKENNYLAGLIAALSVTGVRVTVLPMAALLAVLMDGNVTADGIVVAHIDGGDPSTQTNARAAFAVSVFNNHASSGVEYGLDLFYSPPTEVNDLLSGTAKAFAPSKAEMRFHNGLWFVALDTAITANVTTTSAPNGSIGITSHATGRGKLFMSDGTKWQFAAVA
jgi:hypothetical protein